MSSEELAQQAADRVREVIAEAERRAAEIVREAEADAERIREAARAETPDPRPDPAPTPPVPHPDPTPPGDPVPEPPKPEPVVPPATTASSNGTVSDDAAARLMAMKLALDGKGRDEIASELEAKLGAGERGPLLDDVLARAGR
jgi:cell division septum initiation protein DivIVA